MEQRFLTPAELQKQEAERLAQQATTSAAQQDTALQVGKRLDPEVVDGLMRQLSEQEGSKTDPRWMLPHEREALLEQLTRQARFQKRLRRGSQIVYAIGATLFIGFNLAYFSEYIKYVPSITLPLVISFMVAALCVNLAEKRWGRAAERMALFDDLRATGPLLEALNLRDKAVVAAAEKALLGLLPRLQASDAHSITQAQRECLYRRLKIENAQTEAEFLIAALKALEQVGDARALPCVEALAASRVTTANGTRVREAARQCLAFLKARAEQKQSSDSLLRASSGADASSEALLRPAADNPPTDPQHLLRPSSPESGSPR
jgi:hypothetical protein